MELVELASLPALVRQQNSELRLARSAVDKRPDNALGLLLRALSREEIAVMEDRGCRADDWNRVRVAQDFDPFRVRRVSFSGDCVLGRLSGEIALLPGLTLPCGVYDATLRNCQVGNDCLIEKVRFAAQIVIEHGAVLFDVGTITCSPGAVFGCGQRIPLAVETGGRELPLWAELRIPEAAVVTRERGNTSALCELESAVEEYVQAVRSPCGWVRRGARISHSVSVQDAYIGFHAVIERAGELRDVCVLSSAEEPTRVGGGADVISSILQWGVSVDGGAHVRGSALLEHSGVDVHGAVEHSVIGPNTRIEKGEVTASLVGPFVGFHHQSMLIAVNWPEGRGNVAYGAMVGSNHTGRAPDQECWPGEGMFFGLGCSIRFPACFADAPYTVISAGVSTLPQRMDFPFSLITTPMEPAEDQPRAYNELLPGWTLDENAYGLVRSELKFAKRNKAKRHHYRPQVLRPHIVRLIDQALRRLEAVTTVRDIYDESHIPGLGKNFLRESARQRGIAAYRHALCRYALRVRLAAAEGHEQPTGATELAADLVRRFLPDADWRVELDELVRIEERMAEIVARSKLRDLERGERIIPGYAQAHRDGEDDPVVQSARERVRTTHERVQRLLSR